MKIFHTTSARRLLVAAAISQGLILASSPVMAAVVAPCTTSVPGFGGIDCITQDFAIQSADVDLVFDDTDSLNWSFAPGEAGTDMMSLQDDNGTDILVVEQGNEANAIRINSAGNVGLGTATPGAQLHVLGGSILDNGADSWSLNVNGNGGLEILDVGGNFSPVFIEDQAPAWSFYLAGEENGGSNSGNAGFGTPFATEAVTVERDGGAARFQLTSYTDVASEAPQFVQRRAKGTLASPASLSRFDNLGLISFRGHNGTSYTGTRAVITAQAAENWAQGSEGTRLLFGTTQNGTGSTTIAMEISHDGKVLINGTQLNVPDYVFEDAYELRSLAEVSEFIEKEKHLPGIPNAAEVKLNGLDLTGMQLKMLEKVEELTLYTIEQQNLIEELREANDQIREEMAELRKSLSNG